MSIKSYFGKNANKAISAILGVSIRCCFVHPVTFGMVFQTLDTRNILGEIEDLGLSIKKEDIKWDTLVFGPEITEIKMSSNKAGNADTRGGGCGNLGLDVSEFYCTTRNCDGITLRDLTTAAYQMKGSKYDWWYELYSGITIKIRDSTATIKIEFDYGS